VEEAASAGIDIKEVYVRDGDDAPAGIRTVPFTLEARTFDSVNDTVSPQGVLAVCAVPLHGAPEINAGTASLVASVINPAVGLGSFLAQLFLREPLSRAATQEFHIDGTWTEPRVTRVVRPAAPPAPSGGVN
jgi:hypothetical protein